MTGRARRRLRIDRGALDPGMRIEIAGDAFQHLRVMRLRPGATIELFDGHGGSAKGRLESMGSDRAIVRLDDALDASSESLLTIVLVQALPVKLPRMDLIVRQCTEVGVATIVPVLAQRSQLPGGGAAVIERRCQRWRTIAESAAQQSGRVTVPEVRTPLRIGELDWGTVPTPIVVLDPDGEALRAGSEVLDRARAEQGIGLVVGPEGGLTEAELAELPSPTRVRVGPRILRADTAGVVGATLIQYLCGDLGVDPASASPDAKPGTTRS